MSKKKSKKQEAIEVHEKQDLYLNLRHHLEMAYDQAAHGKGSERHAEENQYFEDQLICNIGGIVGPGFNLGQAIKKTAESIRLKEIKGPEAAKHEIYGAINYLAAACILIDRNTALDEIK